MKYTKAFMLEDVEEVKRLIRENPWATMISNTATGLIASHFPVIPEEGLEGISIVSHLGRPDEKLHELGQHEVLILIQGPHGYISPGWYDANPAVPTWNHVTAHIYGVPEILGDEENYRELGKLVDYFEDHMPEPRRMEQSEEYARSICRGTEGFRVRVTRFEARLKLSQNKPEAFARRIISELENGDNYANPALAREMRRVHDISPST